MTAACDVIEPSVISTRDCNVCGQLFTLPPFKIASRYVRTCPECSDKKALEDQANYVLECQAKNLERWRAICPALYVDSKPAMLPKPLKLQPVLKWAFGGRGLILHGKSGTGKTRCAWLMLKRHFQDGRSILCIDAAGGYEYAAMFAHSPKDASLWMERRIAVDILFLDDIFKVKLTDSFEQAVFVLIEKRTSEMKPIICTTNDTGTTLLARMSSDRGPALLRRLREFCDQIAFD